MAGVTHHVGAEPIAQTGWQTQMVVVAAGPTATQLPALKGVLMQVKALGDNEASIWVGNSSSVATSAGTAANVGFELQAGDSTPPFRLTSLDQLWIIGTAGEGVTVLVIG